MSKRSADRNRSEALAGRDIPYCRLSMVQPSAEACASASTLAEIENRKGDALMRLEKDPTLTDDEREQMKQAVQDNYENQLRIAGSPVPHFNYSTQRQGKGKRSDLLGVR